MELSANFIGDTATADGTVSFLLHHLNVDVAVLCERHSIALVSGALQMRSGLYGHSELSILQARVAGLKLKDTWCFHSTAHRRVKAAIEEVRHARTNNRQVASWTTPGAPHTSERFPRTPVSVILNGNAFGGLPMAALSFDCTANNRDSTIREVCAQPDFAVRAINIFAINIFQGPTRAWRPAYARRFEGGTRCALFLFLQRWLYGQQPRKFRLSLIAACTLKNAAAKGPRKIRLIARE